MRVLVTGSTGFTGSHLTQKLLNDGHQVRVLDRKKNKLKIKNTDYLEPIEGDITDINTVKQATDGIDKVFHIAAVFRTAGISDKIYWDTHVLGTKNLLQASLENGVKRFVHCSTVGVHGHIENPPANETYRFKPGDIYQVTKLEGEKTALKFFQETGLPVSVVRPTAIYGPGDDRLLKLFKMASKKNIIILGDGKIFYHMVYIDDLVNGFILASEKEKAIGQSFIVGGEEVLTLNELMKTIADVIEKEVRFFYLPATPFQLAGTLCEKICIPLGINPPIYRRRIDFFTKSRAFDISKAKEILNYQPSVSLRSGLKKTADWYQENGLL